MLYKNCHKCLKDFDEENRKKSSAGPQNHFSCQLFQKSHLPLAEDTCLLGVGGTIEASQVAAVQYSDRILTSVAARSIQEHVIVVIGTAGGEILQVRLNFTTTLRDIEKICVRDG